MFGIGSQSQFDGGFVATQSDSGPSPAKNRLDQRLMPVTVKQISEASHSSGGVGGDKSDYQIDGVDVTNVKLVGTVFDKVERVTDVTFTIDDGTGRIGCKRWFNDAYDKKEMETIEDGAYVRLTGHLRSFQNNPQISVFSVRPLTDFNEVTHHFVECVHNYLKNSSQPKADSFSQSQSMDSSQSQRTPVKVEPNGFNSTPPNQFSLQNNVDGLKDIDQKVLSYLEQPSSLSQEKGIHRNEIAQQLKLPVEKIAEAIAVLEEEGLIYSTIDEFHFKSAAQA